MKVFSICFFIWAFNISFSAQSLWQIKPNSANFAVLISDYKTYEFEKGYFSVHKANTNSEDKLPIESKYNPPVDFGNITFLYSEDHDTLFSGDIIWQGIGHILFPREFIPKDSFAVGQAALNEPISKEYFVNFYTGESEPFNSQIDTVWMGINNLDIVNDFSQYPYRVGIFLYLTGVGVPIDTAFVNYIDAKWVTLLYVNNPGTSEIKNDNFISNQFELSQNYPNPFNPTTIISFTIPNVSDVKFASTTLKIYDILGNEVTTLVNGKLNPGNFNVEFNATNLSSGIYFYKIVTYGFSETKKMVLLR